MTVATVEFECEGGFPERFLNTAREQDIELWCVRRCGISLFCRCRAADYRALRPIAKAASVRMRVRRRYGVWFRIRPFRRRIGLAVGLVLFTAILQLLSARIWVIRVRGNERVSETEIREVLRPLGVYEGAVFEKVELPWLQLTALEELPQLVWLTVNRTGSVAYIEVKERQPSEPIASTEPANLVAVRDGVVLSVECASGQAAVKEGDAVTEGSLLISGVVDSKVGPLMKHAQGTVMARTQRQITVSVPFAEEVPSDNPPVIDRPTFYLLGLRIPLYTSGAVPPNHTARTERYPLRAYGRALPIGIEVTRLIGAETVLVQRSAEEAYEEALTRLAVQRSEWGDAVVIEDEQITSNQTESGWTVTGQYVCKESIGVYQPLQMHEKNR